MTGTRLLISTGNLTRATLAGQVTIVTGAGGGIGFEAARALAWLGARVVIAEIRNPTGKAAAERIAQEMGQSAAMFIQTDVGDERSVRRLARQALRTHGKVDVVLNNATITPIGAVKDVSIQAWDASYRVNLRGPVLLARAFLPGMLEQNAGVFVCVSSVGDAYLGPYETFKAAQVHLANTLDAELAGAEVIAFTIGPGLVPGTPGAQYGIQQVAPLYGKTMEEFYAMSQEHILSAEAAGAGFAAAIALASRFRGQEISSKQALIAAGIDLEGEPEAAAITLTAEKMAQALSLCREVRATLAQQVAGWSQRPLFERQWVIRDFSKNAGMPSNQWLDTLGRLERCLEAQDLATLATIRAPLDVLARYYRHWQELAEGYVKDPQVLQEQLQTLHGYEEAAAHLAALLDRGQGEARRQVSDTFKAGAERL